MSQTDHPRLFCGRRATRNPVGRWLLGRQLVAGAVTVGFTLLIAASASAQQQWGAWMVATKVHTLTDKKTTFAQGRGDGIVMEVFCNILTYEHKNFFNKRSLDVWFQISGHLGVRRPPIYAIFRVDQRPALEVQLAKSDNNTVHIFYGNRFVFKLLEEPATLVRFGFTAADGKRHDYSLPLDGMVEAIDALKKDCGMTPQNTWRSTNIGPIVQKDDSIRPIQ